MIRKTTANYESYRDSLLNLSSAMRRSVPASLEFPFVDGLDKFTVGLRLIYRKNKNPFRPRNPTQLAGSARRWRGDCKPFLYFQSIQERWITAGSIRFPNEGKRSQPKTRVGRDDGKNGLIKLGISRLIQPKRLYKASARASAYAAHDCR